jgi:hypothetical protein
MTDAYDYDALLAEQPSPPSSPANEYDALIVERDREEQLRLRANLLDAYGRDSEETARAIPLSKQTGIPVDTVVRNFASAEAAAAVERDFAIVRGHAGLEKWLLQDPVNARVAQGDHEKLGFVEWAWRGVTDTLIRAPAAGILFTIGGTLAGAGETYAIMERLSARLFDAVGVPTTGIDLPWYLHPAEILRRPGERIKALARDVDVPEERRTAADRVGSGIGQIGAQVLQTIATGGSAALAQLFSQGVDQMVDDVRQAGKYGTLEGDATAVVGGTVTALAEKMGIDLLLNRVPPAIKNKVLRTAADIMVAGGTEATEEFFEQVARNGVQNVILGTKKPLLEGAFEGVGEAGAAAAIVRGAMKLRGRPSGEGEGTGRRPNLSVQEVMAEARVAAVDKLIDAAGGTALATRSPEKLEEFVRSLSEAPQDVLVPAEPVQQHLEMLPPAEAQRQAEALGITEQLPDALAQGGDVAIPLAKYVVEAGRSGAHQTWRDDIRFELDGTSLNDAREETDLRAESAGADPDGTTRALIAGKPTNRSPNDSAARPIDNLPKAASEPRATVEFGKAYPELVAVAEQAGLLVDSLVVPLNPLVVRHIRASQRAGKSERAQGQMPVMTEHAHQIPQLVATPDIWVLRKKSQIHPDVVAYGKRLEDGSTLWLETIRRRSHGMVGQSLRRYGATVNVVSVVSGLDPGSRSNRGGSGGDRFEVVYRSATSSGTPSAQFHGDEPGSPFRLGFASEETLQTYLGPAGKDWAWHHIVEKWQVPRFGAQAIHNTGNIIRIPKHVHDLISGFYSSKRRISQGLIVRQWLSAKSFDEQYQFGMDQMSKFLGYR